MKLPCRFLDSLAETNKQNAEIYVGLTHVLVYHFLVIKWFKINLSITDKTKKKNSGKMGNCGSEYSDVRV